MGPYEYKFRRGSNVAETARNNIVVRIFYSIVSLTIVYLTKPASQKTRNSCFVSNLKYLNTERMMRFIHNQMALTISFSTLLTTQYDMTPKYAVNFIVPWTAMSVYLRAAFNLPSSIVYT